MHLIHSLPSSASSILHPYIPVCQTVLLTSNGAGNHLAFSNILPTESPLMSSCVDNTAESVSFVSNRQEGKTGAQVMSHPRVWGWNTFQSHKVTYRTRTAVWISWHRFPAGPLSGRPLMQGSRQPATRIIDHTNSRQRKPFREQTQTASPPRPR